MQAKVSTPFIAIQTCRVWLMLGALTLMAGSVWAQAANHQPQPIATDRGKAAGPQQQRRAALRAALQAQREGDAPKADRHMRQLTPAERAKLREQLRQQRHESPQQRDGLSQ